MYQGSHQNMGSMQGPTSCRVFFWQKKNMGKICIPTDVSSSVHCHTLISSVLYYMDSVLSKLAARNFLKERIKNECLSLGFKHRMVSDFSISKLKHLIQKFSQIPPANTPKSPNFWYENELKTFLWVLLALSIAKDQDIESFARDKEGIVFDIFKSKTRVFLEYEIKRVAIEKMCRNLNWTPEEDASLVQITQSGFRIGSRWNQVARLLFERSEGRFFRLGKHCRQRWLNHLDPTIKRGPWTMEEDQQLMSQALEKGKKWSELAEMLNRTEHNTKNRYYQLISKYKKYCPGTSRQLTILEKVVQTIGLPVQEQIKEENGEELPLKIEEALEFNSGSIENQERKSHRSMEKAPFCNKELLKLSGEKVDQKECTPHSPIMSQNMLQQQIIANQQHNKISITGKDSGERRVQDPNSKTYYPFLEQSWACRPPGYSSLPSYPSPPLPFPDPSFRAHYDRFMTMAGHPFPTPKIEEDQA